MSQVGRISGPLLQENLERNGIDLAFRNDLNTTQLLYLDVNSNKIGVNTSTPSKELEVLGTTRTTDLKSTTSLNTPGYEITGNTFRVLLGDINLASSDAIVMSTLETDQIRISDNIISTINTSSNIELRPELYSLDELQDGLLETSRGVTSHYLYPFFTEVVDGFARGDANHDGQINIDDVMAMIAYQNNPQSTSPSANHIREYIVGRRATTEIINDLNIYGNLDAAGNITFGGDITVGDNQGNDRVIFQTDIDTDIVPDANNTYDLGSDNQTGGKRWDNLYTFLINGNVASLDELTVQGIQTSFRAGGIFWVDPNGNDDNVGDNPMGAMRTLAATLSRVDPSSSQPFTVFVNAGEYEEVCPLVVPENVTIIGNDIRNTIIKPTVATQDNDIFHLEDKSVISNLTIKDFKYDSVNNTGYAFRFAPNAVMSERSPYIQDVTVVTNPTTPGGSDAGRGAWIDGNELNSASPRATMLFHSCTFISPGADVINMTNGVRVEWLNSFTYYANRGLYAFNGTEGRTSIDGSTTIYGAELRSIGSANVYGTYGAVADGADCLMYLIQHNFAYIGAGTDSTNDLDLVVQANEVVETNSGQIHYVSTDQVGNFRVGDNFFVNFETGNTSLTIDTADIDTLSGLVINSPGGTSTIDGGFITTGDILIQGNNISTNIGDLTLSGSTGTINLKDNTSVSGSVSIRDNFSFGGTLNIAGDQPGRITDADKLIFNVAFEQNFNPHQTLTHSLGEVQRPWLETYLDKLTITDIEIDGNVITTTNTSADLELRASGTGEILVPSNDVQIDNNLTVAGDTSLQDTVINGTVDHIGQFNQTGNRTIIGDLNITEWLDITQVVDLGNIQFDDNFITTTTANTNLELRANNLGKIFVPYENVHIVQDLLADNINISNVTVSQQTGFDAANVSDILIDDNFITTTNTSANLELRAGGTGKINAQSSVEISNNLDVEGTTRFEDGFTGLTFGTELVVNGTFDNNVNGWSQTGGGFAIVSNGNLQIHAIGAARNVSQEITVEPGKTYDFTAQFRGTGPGQFFYLRIFESGVGTLQEWNNTTGLTADEVLTYSFVPQGTEVDIIFRSVDNIVEWDNVSVVENKGILTTFTPVQVNLDGALTQTGNTAQTGDIAQTGNTVVSGTLTTPLDLVTTVISIDDNKIENTQEGLRMSLETADLLSLPEIVKAIVAGSTAADYATQQEKNLINFLIDNDYVDVNRSGSITTTDYIAYLQYIGNGQTNSAVFDEFLKGVVEALIAKQYETPFYFNQIIFLGDYNNPDLEFRAAGTGEVLIPNDDVIVSNNLSAGLINANNINISADLDLNEIIIATGVMEIDDNFISTTDTQADLELRAPAGRQIEILQNDAEFNNNLEVSGSSTLSNININGNIIQTGNRNQIGDLNVEGTVTVTTSNIQSEIQFDDISFDDNVITTTNSQADLELVANGTGVILMPTNDVTINNDITTGTLNANNISIDTSLTFEEFELSSDIQLFDNVITTTNTSSNLELRTIDNSNIRLQNILVNNDNISTETSNIDFTTNNINITSTDAIKIPIGTTSERQLEDSGIRFNTTDNVFEAFRNSNTITFNGIYSDNRQTNVLAHPTNNTININVIDSNVTNITNVGIDTHGLTVDDVTIEANTIKTNSANLDLDLRADGTGGLVIDDVKLSTNTITNTAATALTLRNTLYGVVKFDGHSVKIPSGTTAEQPGFTPESGMMRWNTENDVLEVWDGTTFITAAGTSATLSADEMDDLILEYTLIFG